MKPCFPLLLAGLCCLAFSVSAQSPKIKFGEVDVADLQSRTYAPDSAAEAVVLSDVATSKFEYGAKGFALRTDRHTRIKILKKSGYDHATVRVPYYRLDGQSQEVLENLKGFTYNLENGQVKKDRLGKEAVFDEKKDDNWLEKRFTLPNVREGSIVEYSYSLVSDFWYQMRDWSFQTSIPTAWSEYRVVIPEYFYYKLNSGGYEQLAITEEKPGSQNFSIMVQGAGQQFSGRGTPTGFDPTTVQNVQALTTEYHFAGKDLPAIRTEAYMTTLYDYVTKVEFDLASIRMPGQQVRHFSNNWESLSEMLLKSEAFGGALRQRGFLKDAARAIPASPDTALRAASAWQWVAGQMKYNGTETKYAEATLKKAFDAHAGNVADLNLTLVALLREAGLDAHPVILSTRDHGRVKPWHAQSAKFNYVVAAARVGDHWLLLDATEPTGKPGVLPTRCLNGDGWLVREKGGEFVSLEPTDRHMNTTMLTLALDADGGLSGKADFSNMGYAGASVRRELLSGGPEKYAGAFRKARPSWEFPKLDVSNLENPAEALALSCSLHIGEGAQVAGGRMYLKPLLTEGEDENPFKQEQRRYPVDFAAPLNHNVTAVYTLPEGFAVEELPKNTAVALPDGAGRFVYTVAASGNRLQVTSRVAINKTMFLPDEYPILKEFFDKIVAKHAEQVVLKKL